MNKIISYRIIFKINQIQKLNIYIKEKNFFGRK